MGLIASITVHLLMKRENAKRDRLYGPPPATLLAGEKHDEKTLDRLGLMNKSDEEIIGLGDKNPAFRYIL